MATNKKSPKQTAKKLVNKKPVKLTKKQALMLSARQPFSTMRSKSSAFLKRRPHRSFRRTRRRDYVRSLELPGYFAFTTYVHKTLWKNRKLIAAMVVVYALLTALMVGVASQDTYTTLSDTLRETGGSIFDGNFGELGKASLLFIAAMTGGLSQTLTEVQQVYAAILGLMVWLTTVWLLRNILAGHKVKLRDGLYNASAPILSTFVVVIVMLVQLLPFALALIGYSAAMASGLLAGGVEAMIFWLSAGLLTALSLYWITSTAVALVVVTLPGMYPFRAIKTAGDLVVGRRLRILLRMLWMGLMISLVWIVIMIPIILLDTWVKGIWPVIDWIPTIPLALLIMGSMTLVWSSSYIYLLYRRIVADDSDPA
ncbi:MAG TPA: hypothetical protein PLZ58_02130 [Candidatus Saccharibacteria bacterium]|nr:hypothetical protein [Candidatus Saccharibacteria bacterium]HRQ06575.1 hypothetical protein [Candidatus Saccharibacteria bacterium]